MEQELSLADKRNKREIRLLEGEIPLWQVIVEKLNAASKLEFLSFLLEGRKFSTEVNAYFHNLCDNYFKMPRGNSLVLHCTSPSAHDIATSKVTVIFTGCLRRGEYGPLFSPNSFNSDFNNSTWLKRGLS